MRRISGENESEHASRRHSSVEAIPITEESLAPLEQVAPGIAGLRIVFVNVFAIDSGSGGWVLVDAGLRFSAGRIRNWCEKHFGENSRPEAIVLTHGHFDHVGALDELLEHWDVPVYAHTAEMPYVSGASSYPPPDPSVGGGLMAVMSPLYPRGPIDLGDRVRALPADGSVPGLAGWRWVHTPGHTKGHVSLFRDSDRTLVVGDAFCTTRQESFLAVAQQRPELNGPPMYYTPDWTAARASVEKLAALRPMNIAPGHGLPMSGPEVPELIDALARSFDEIAKPEHGRYVDTPGGKS